MKKSIFKKLGGLFLGLAMGLGVVVGVTAGNKASEVKAAEKTIEISTVSNTTVSDNGGLFTITFAKAGSETAPAANASRVRCYALKNSSGTKITITSNVSGNTINSVSIGGANVSGKSNLSFTFSGDGTVQSTAGTWPHTVSYTNSSITSVTAQCKNSTGSAGQADVSAITIKYNSSGSGGDTTNYTVTFDANGHGTAPKAVTVASGGKVSEPTAPTADDCTFEGWYRESGCTTQWNFSTDTVSSNITLYAKWTENGSSGGGDADGTWTLVTDASTLKSGDILAIACNSKGKVAGGFNTKYLESVSATFSTDASKSSFTSTDVEPLTLGGSTDAWTLTNSDGLIGRNSSGADLALNPSTNTTWFISISSGTATIKDSGSNQIKYNSVSPRFKTYSSGQNDVQLYRFEEALSDQSRVTYDANGGTGSTIDSNSPYENGSNVTILGNSFTAPDYKKFNGWNTSADGNGTTYTVGQIVTSIQESLTLYAQWTDDDIASITVTNKPTQVYQGKQIALSSVTITVNYSGGSTKTGESPTSIECNTNSIQNNVEATAYYGDASTKFSINVVAAPDGYSLVTDLSADLVDGSTVLLIGFNGTTSYAAKEYNYNWKEDGLSSAPTNLQAETVSINNNFISTDSLSGKNVGIFMVTVTELENKKFYSFSDSFGKYLYAAASNKNQLKTESEISDNSLFEVNIVNGVFTIQATKSSNRNIIKFNKGNNPVIFSCYSSGQTEVKLFAKAPEILVQNGTKVELSGDRTYYNATKNTSLLTSDLKVSKLAGEKTIRGSENTTGIGYTAYVYSDSACSNLLDTIDATLEVGSYSFDGMEITGTQKSVYVKVNYDGFISENALEIVVNRKNPTAEDKLNWVTEPQKEYLSALDTFKIKGELTGKYNAGGVIGQSEPVRFELYSGSTVSEQPIFSTTTYQYGGSDHDLTLATFNRENGYTIPNGSYLSVYENTSILKYTTDTTFTYRITLLNYTANNFVDTTVTVYAIELGATDNMNQTYYKGGSYTMGADVVAYYGQDMNEERAITDTSLYSIVMPEGQGTIKFIPKEATTYTITVQLKIDSNIKDTFNITVNTPSDPQGLEILLNDSYHAGDEFAIAMGEVDYGDNVTDDIESDDPNLSFIISPTTDPMDSRAKSLKDGDTLLLSQDKWYVFASYTVLKTTVSAEPEQISILQMELTNTYTPAQESNTFEKVTSSLNDWSGTYLIVYESGTNAYTLNGVDESNGYVSSTISSGKITNSDSLIKIEIGKYSDGYSLKYLNGDLAGKYLSGTAAKKLNSSDNPVEHSITFNTDHIEINCGSNGLKFNKDSNQLRFRYYASGQEHIQLYKLGITPAVGDPVKYIMNVIDMARLNNEPTSGSLAVCADSKNLINTNYWNTTDSSIDKVYESLTAEQHAELRVQDRFGEDGKTYEDTVLKLIEVYRQMSLGSKINPILALNNVDNSVWVISAVALVGLTAIGGYFFYRKRKEI